MRALIVAAVSTPHQAAEEKFSIPSQLAACREVCALRGWRVTGEIIIPGHSRNYNWLDELCADCPEYAQLLKIIRSDTIDLVVVRDYDRLWRSDALRAQVMAVCREHRVQVFSLNQPVEPVSPELLDTHDTAKLSEVLFGFISEQENRARVRRWRAGMEGRWRRGLHGAWVVIPYGYRRNPQPGAPMLVYEPEARWVRQIFEWRLQGLGCKIIANLLNQAGVKPMRSSAWMESSVRHILSNPAYCGLAVWKGQTLPGLHEPIVPHDVWQRVQIMAKEHPVIRRPIRSPLAGLLRCGYCGSLMSLSRRRGRVYAQCNRYVHYRLNGCRSNAHWEHHILPVIMAEVKRVMADPEAYRAALNEDDHYEQEIAALEAEIAEYERRWRRWDQLYESGAISADELLRHRQELLGQADRARGRLDSLRAEQAIRASRARKYHEMSRYLDMLDTLPADALRAILHALIRRIVLVRGQPPQIVWW